MARCRQVPIGLFVLCLWLMSSASVAAWEEDVHYLLTFWLAERAGFSRNDADEIAAGDQGRDTSKHNDAVSTVLWVLLTGDQEAARTIQLYHFPHDAKLPSPAMRRVVAPNNGPAREAVEKEIAVAKTVSTVRSLGEALHPFQDSWSHQGVPDIPWNLRPDLVSAHPAARGGWRLHDADLTHLHVEEVVTMARETYELYLRYLNAAPGRRVHPSATWSTLQPIVEAFARASTQSDKATWAAQNVPQPTMSSAEASNRLTLPGGSGRQPEVTSLRPRRATAELQVFRARLAANISGAGGGQARDSAIVSGFFGAWLSGNIAQAVDRIDWNTMAGQFRGEPRLSQREAIIEWCKKFLAIPLTIDHGRVDALGHGDPSHPGYEALPTEFRDAPAILPKFVGIRPQDLFETNVAGEPGLGLIVSFSTLPHDTFGFVWSRADGRIIRMFSVVE